MEIDVDNVEKLESEQIFCAICKVDHNFWGILGDESGR